MPVITGIEIKKLQEKYGANYVRLLMKAATTILPDPDKEGTADNCINDSAHLDDDGTPMKRHHISSEKEQGTTGA